MNKVKIDVNVLANGERHYRVITEYEHGESTVWMNEHDFFGLAQESLAHTMDNIDKACAVVFTDEPILKGKNESN